jgi:hypothetical protein
MLTEGMSDPESKSEPMDPALDLEVEVDTTLTGVCRAILVPTIPNGG